MKKIVLLFVTLMLFSASSVSFAANENETIETSLQKAIKPIGNKEIRVTGSDGEMLEVFNLTGIKVMEIRIDNTDTILSLDLPKGCYILKVNKIVRKISIQ